MIEQRARIAAISNGQLGLAPVSTTGCARCASGQGCGAQLFGGRQSAAALLWLSSPLAASLRIGDEVLLTVSAGLLQRSSLRLYALPLLLMLVVVVILAALQLSESIQLVAAVLSLLLPVALRRWRGPHRESADVSVIQIATAPCSITTAANSGLDGKPPP